MTADEWLTSTDPDLMLSQIKDDASSRKLRLFAVACCRRIWRLLKDERSRKAVDAAEVWADRADAKEEDFVSILHEANHAVREGRALVAADTNNPLNRICSGEMYGSGCYTPAEVAAATLKPSAAIVDVPYVPAEAAAFVASIASGPAGFAETWIMERAAECSLLREIFGNPFTPRFYDSSHLADGGVAVTKMARRIYEDGRFAELPQLFEALKDAGCTDSEILAHCRSGENHVRGCWVVDLILSKDG